MWNFLYVINYMFLIMLDIIINYNIDCMIEDYR